VILTGTEIKERVTKGEIIIKPFDDKALNPNSYNFRLGDYVKVYKNKILDPKVIQEVEIIEIPDTGLVLETDKVYLGFTKEQMGSANFVPIISGRSSTGRLGLFVHITADLIDIGSVNNWTLQMHATQRVKVYKNMLIGQVTFWKPLGKIHLYEGKYQGSTGPVESHIWKDFN
jgi:dCTP deaminase